jgi:hypothetical protein
VRTPLTLRRGPNVLRIAPTAGEAPGDRSVGAPLRPRVSPAKAGSVAPLAPLASPPRSLTPPPVDDDGPGGSDEGCCDSDSDSAFAGPSLTGAGYSVEPALAALRAMSPKALRAVRGFTVHRAGFGSVRFEGAVDLRGLDLDAAVSFERKQCSVRAPQLLRVPHVVTLLGVRPAKSGPAPFRAKVEATTTALGAELVAFDAAAGTWVFRCPAAAAA